MGFRVHNPTGYEELGDQASYTFNEAGLLVVHLGVHAGRVTYTSNAWTAVEEPDRTGKYHLAGVSN